MLILSMILALAVPAPQAATAPELPVLNARLGNCSATFTVRNAEGAPVYLALVHVRVRYGTMGIKRIDLEVGTNSEGRARITGLPSKARPMTYDISKDDKKTTIDQDVTKTCDATLDVVLE